VGVTPAPRTICSTASPQRRSHNWNERRECEVNTCAVGMNADRALQFQFDVARLWSNDSKRQSSALAPEAVHARHDHRAARPKFLDIGRRAVAHRIGTGVIARIDPVGLRLVLRINRYPSRRTPDPVQRGRLGVCPLRRLRHPHPRRRGLRARASRGQHQNACASEPYRRCPDPHHDAHPHLLWTPRSPIAAPASTARQLQNR